MRAALLLPLVALALLAGCGGDPEGGGLRVVGTTTQVADMVATVGGDRVRVDRLLEPNSDPHDYEPRPSDAEALVRAELVIRSGGDLDEWLGDVIDSAGADPEVVTLIDRVAPAGEAGHEDEAHEGEGEAGHADKAHGGEGEAGHAEDGHGGEDEDEAADDGHGHDHDGADPHWWHDPRNGVRAVAAIRDALVAADPAGRAAYASNARAYARQLERLDGAVARCMAAIPPERRKLVSTHDSLGAFARRYDVTVVGSVLDSLSTQAQPSAGDTQDLIDQMRAEGVRVIFAESSVDPRLERAIAHEAGARVGEPLWADSLGPEGSSGDTYLKSLAADANAIARGLGGAPCRLPAPR